MSGDILIYEKNDHETTEAHFKKFQSSVLRYVDMFGLKEWYVTFCHKDMDSLAACTAQNQGKSVCFSLSKKWGWDEPTDGALDRTAFHEVMELMLDEYNEIICDGDLSVQLKKEWRERVDHAVIRRLENVVLPRL